MKRNLLFILLSISSLIGYSQQLIWTPIADFPNSRILTYSFMIGDSFYVGCGLDTVSPVFIAANDLWEYNPSTNAWSPKTPLNGGLKLYGASSFVINGKAYVVDGQILNSTYNTTLQEYDPATDSWTSMASFPGTPGYTATAFSIGPYGFLGMGFSPYTDSFYRYNSLNNTWAPIAPFPGVGRQGASAFVINGIAYVGAGGIETGPTFINYNDFYKYDTVSGQWSAIDSFPGTARRYGPCFTFGGKGYIIGGSGTTGSDVYNDVWSYDPIANNWTQLDTFPVTIWQSAFGSNGHYAIAGLGQNAPGNMSNQLWQTGYPTSITETAMTNANIWFYNNTVHIRFQESLSDNSIFSLYDLSGREVSNIQLQRGESSFDLSYSQLTSGIYLYKVSSTGLQSENQIGKITILN